MTAIDRDREAYEKVVRENQDLAESVASLRDGYHRIADVVRPGMYAPSGVPICACRNVNAVKAGIEKACWYCDVRAALSSEPSQEEGKS